MIRLEGNAGLIDKVIRSRCLKVLALNRLRFFASSNCDFQDEVTTGTVCDLQCCMQAVIFTGIQGSGKTTFFKDEFFRTHLRISLDLFRTRYREGKFLQTCFDTSMRFVIDNTNPTVPDRARYIRLAKEAHFKVIGYFFDSPLEDALNRNAIRTEKEIIPEKGIRATLNKLQGPTLAEGFDELYRVTINQQGLFVVESIDK